MLRATGFGGPLPRPWARRIPGEPRPPFRTSPTRIATVMLVALLLLGNVVLVYHLTRADHSPVALVLGKRVQNPGANPEFQKLRGALESLSPAQIGVANPSLGDAHEADRGNSPGDLSTVGDPSKSTVASSTTGSTSSGSASSGSSSGGSSSDGSGTDPAPGGSGSGSGGGGSDSGGSGSGGSSGTGGDASGGGGPGGGGPSSGGSGGGDPVGGGDPGGGGGGG